MNDLPTPHNRKRLFLLRHALAMPAGSSAEDSARPLAPKGEEDATALGLYMAQKGYLPDLILCSTAKRTQQTLQNLQKKLETPAARFLKILYTGRTGDLLSEIQKAEDDKNSILIVAHNPSIYELAVLLGGTGKESLLQRLCDGYRPATLTVLGCPCAHWADIQPQENEVIDLVDPLDYNAPARPTRWM